MSIIDPAPGVATRSITLRGGRLEVHVDAASAWPLETLCDFAARDNPQRGFLVVSRVLGRHLPATPAAMQAAAEALAARLPLLAGPVVFLGMAETAIALGQTVFAAWRAETGRDDAMFLHSTRQDLGIAPAARFAEPHSHAAAHLLYAPLDRELRQLLAAAATLVIVDDEVSSGATAFTKIGGGGFEPLSTKPAMSLEA